MSHQVFISYSRKDIGFVRKLARDLEEAGFNVWWDTSDLVGGANWVHSIQDALTNSEHCIVVLSADSLESEWVGKEYTYALGRSINIIPLLYRECEIPLALFDIQYVDFQGDTYGSGFQQLLRVLGAEKSILPPRAEKRILPNVAHFPKWQMIGVVIAIIAFIWGVTTFFIGGNPDNPTPTSTHTAITVAVGPTLTRTSTRTSKPNTPTPTKKPSPTLTPRPTSTPRPTATPTATIDADPTVYDNFNDPTYDGSFRRNLWRVNGSVTNIKQQDGVLVVAHTTSSSNDRTALEVSKAFSLGEFDFYESEIMLQEVSTTGNTHGNIQMNIESNDLSWWSQCLIHRYPSGNVNVSCIATSWPVETKFDYQTEFIQTNINVWHRVRIEIVPDTFQMKFYIDGQFISSHIPKEAEQLKNSKFTLSVGCWSSDGSALGQIDNVRIAGK